MSDHISDNVYNLEIQFKQEISRRVEAEAKVHRLKQFIIDLKDELIKSGYCHDTPASIKKLIDSI